MDRRMFFTCKLIVFCTLNAIVVFGCPGLPQSFGSSTEDSVIEEGSSLDIICELYANKVNFKGTDYVVSSSNLIIKKEKVLGNTTVLNDKSIMWKLHHGTLNDTGLYQCLVEIPNEQPLLICTTSVKVGYKPLPVSNFSCESINYSNLTCQWSLPKNPIKETYYTLRQILGIPFKCPEKTATGRGCWWTADTQPVYFHSAKEFRFVLTGKNGLGTSEQQFSIHHSEIVRPGPPRLDIISIVHNNVTFSFKPSVAMEHLPLHIPLQYELCLTVGNLNETCEIFDGHHTVKKHLIPFQEYKCRLRCKSKNARNDMWGPFSEVRTVQTEKDVPYLAPATASSLFHSEIFGNNRTISVYWEKVPEINHNGPDFCYLLSCYPCKNSLIKKELKECARNYVQIKHLALNECYTFRICPLNAAGMSSNCSYVNVEEASKCE